MDRLGKVSLVLSLALGIAMVACGGGSTGGATGDEEDLTSGTPWCNAGHTADSEEGNFNGFGGVACNAAEKAKCKALGGHLCKGYVDVKYLFCACGNGP
jgi:hypothetical protein